MKNLFILAVLLASSSSVFAATANTYKLNCGGTEPFWSVSVNSSATTYSSPETIKGIGYFDAKVTEAAGVTPGNAFEIVATAQQGKKRLALSVMNAGTQGCNDGMSEVAHQYQVLANIDGVVLSGCCDLAK